MSDCRVKEIKKFDVDLEITENKIIYGDENEIWCESSIGFILNYDFGQKPNAMMFRMDLKYKYITEIDDVQLIALDGWKQITINFEKTFGVPLEFGEEADENKLCKKIRSSLMTALKKTLPTHRRFLRLLSSETNNREQNKSKSGFDNATEEAFADFET